MQKRVVQAVTCHPTTLDELAVRAAAVFRWMARPGEECPARRRWLALVFRVPDGELTHALQISALGPGERLWIERGVLAGDTVWGRNVSPQDERAESDPLDSRTHRIGRPSSTSRRSRGIFFSQS